VAKGELKYGEMIGARGRVLLASFLLENQCQNRIE